MRSWIALALGLLSVSALVPLLQHRASAQGDAREAPVAGTTSTTASSIASSGACLSCSSSSITAGARPAAPAASSAVAPSRAMRSTAAPLSGIDWAHIQVGETESIAHGPGERVAHLTLDAELQQTTNELLRNAEARAGAVVAIDTATGRVLIWAGQQPGKPVGAACSDDNENSAACTGSQAPAASIFKIVTGAALIEKAGLHPDTRQCYSGGESSIVASDLVDDPKRDRWCATLAEAMGRSLNVVFARLALRKLNPAELGTMARGFGFGEPVPFDFRAPPSEVRIPSDDLGFARTAAGFWNTTLSPLHGAWIASTIANGGEPVRPTLVDSVTEGASVVFRSTPHRAPGRIIRPETSQALTEMMETTVSTGTSFRAFHDPEGRPFLPGITVAGKTGTLGRAKTQDNYTWFVGFAPSRAPEIAIAVQIVNGPKWRTKANVVAREVLRAYFAKKGAPGVTRPRSHPN